MERRGHPRIEIKNIHDFNDVCSDMVDEYLDTFTIDNGLVEEITEYTPFAPDGAEFMYTHRAMNLYERYERRLKELADKHFDDSFMFGLRCTKMIMD